MNNEQIINNIMECHKFSKTLNKRFIIQNWNINNGNYKTIIDELRKKGYTFINEIKAKKAIPQKRKKKSIPSFDDTVKAIKTEIFNSIAIPTTKGFENEVMYTNDGSFTWTPPSKKY